MRVGWWQTRKREDNTSREASVHARAQGTKVCASQCRALKHAHKPLLSHPAHPLSFLLRGAPRR